MKNENSNSNTDTNTGIEKVHAVPHFHYDVEWWKTEDGYNKDVSEILDKALEMLEKFPEFTFTIDQALSLRPYWTANPDSHEKFHRFISEGRLELIGGTFCSPDENIPTGEALARQFIYGKRFFEDEVGGKVTTAWEIDVFGHPLQFAQILAKSGLSQFVFARGVQDWRNPETPVHFFWESPDGSRVLCNWFAAHYIGFCLPSLSAFSNKYFRSEFIARLEYEGMRTPAHTLMFPFGSDFTPPLENWIEYVRDWNEKAGAPEVAFSLPDKFFVDLRSRSENDLPVIKEEFNPLLTGCYESREKVKKFCRKSQYMILDAEKWATLAWSRGLIEYPKENLDAAWELILENDFHDIVCGTGTDKVYKATLSRYEKAIENIETAGSAALSALVKLADTQGGGTPFVIFNSLNFERDEIVEIPATAIGCDAKNLGDYSVTGPDGNPLVTQAASGNLLIRLKVPPLGFSVVNVISDRGRSGWSSALDTDSVSTHNFSAENEFLRITVDPRTGSLSSVFDKQLDCEMLKTGSGRLGNEILVEEDAGNLWTVQKTGHVWEGRNYRSKVELIENGPLRVCLESRGRHHDMRCVRRVYLSAGSRRIDFETEIDFRGKDVRVKTMFDTAFQGEITFETPFYSQPRSAGHWCAQNWADISDGAKGLAVINSGNPGMDAENNSLGLVLFRSLSVFSPALVRYVAKNYKDILRATNEAKDLTKKGLNIAEWALYEHHGLMLREWSSSGAPDMKGNITPNHIVPWLLWPMPSDAWERGRHNFRYAVYPHPGTWKSALLPQKGIEFNTPLTPVPTTSHEGTMGRSASLFNITASKDSAILIALKKAEKSDTLIARIYDSLGDGDSIKLSTPTPAPPMKSCRKTNLTEELKGEDIKIKNGSASTEISNWEIASFECEI